MSVSGEETQMGNRKAWHSESGSDGANAADANARVADIGWLYGHRWTSTYATPSELAELAAIMANSAMADRGQQRWWSWLAATFRSMRRFIDVHRPMEDPRVATAPEAHLARFADGFLLAAVSTGHAARKAMDLTLRRDVKQRKTRDYDIAPDQSDWGVVAKRVARVIHEERKHEHWGVTRLPEYGEVSCYFSNHPYTNAPHARIREISDLRAWLGGHGAQELALGGFGEDTDAMGSCTIVMLIEPGPVAPSALSRAVSKIIDRTLAGFCAASSNSGPPQSARLN